MKNIPQPTSHWKEARSYLPCDPACQHFPLKKGFPFYFTPDSSSSTRSFGERLSGTLWKLLSALQIEFERDSLETHESTIEFLNCSILDWLDFQYLLYHMKRYLYDTHFYLLNEMYLSNKLFIFTVNLHCSFLIRINIYIYISSNKHILHFKRQTNVLLRLFVFVQRGYIFDINKITN